MSCAKTVSLTPAEIVAAIAPHPELAVLDQHLTALRARRDEISRTLDTGNTFKTGSSFFEAGRKQKAATEVEITQTRRQHSTLRAEHAAKVRAALAPLQTETVAQFDVALEALFTRWTILDAIAVEDTKIGIRNPRRRLTLAQFKKLVGSFLEAARQ